MSIDSATWCVLRPLSNVGETSWSGLAVNSFAVGSGFHSRTSCPSMHLFLSLRGSPKVNWRNGKQIFNRIWKYGDYSFVGRDLEVFDLSIDGDHEGLAIEMSSANTDVLNENDFSEEYRH